MKKIYILSILLSLSFLSSCKDDEILAPTAANSGKIDSTSTIGSLPSDSLGIKYSMQSNPELILSDRIVYKNSKFVLDLSSEEASELLIPDEVYQKYAKIAEKMNKETEDN